MKRKNKDNEIIKGLTERNIVKINDILNEEQQKLREKMSYLNEYGREKAHYLYRRIEWIKMLIREIINEERDYYN